MANTFREVYKKTGTSSYQLVGNVGVGGVKLDVMKGASSSTAGEIGLVPKPTSGQQDYILTGDGVWKKISDYFSLVPIFTPDYPVTQNAQKQYDCDADWSEYLFLIINGGNYYNFMNTIIMTSEEFFFTKSTSRVQLSINNSYMIEIWRGDTTKQIYIKNNRVGEGYTVRIHGLLKK